MMNKVVEESGDGLEAVEVQVEIVDDSILDWLESLCDDGGPETESYITVDVPAEEIPA